MFAIGAVVASITVHVIFLAVVIDVFNVYLAVDVTTAHIVFFAAAIVIVAAVAVALITIDTVSLVLITVIFVVFAPTIKIDVVCHTKLSPSLNTCKSLWFLPAAGWKKNGNFRLGLL